MVSIRQSPHHQLFPFFSTESNLGAQRRFCLKSKNTKSIHNTFTTSRGFPTPGTLPQKETFCLMGDANTSSNTLLILPRCCSPFSLVLWRTSSNYKCNLLPNPAFKRFSNIIMHNWSAERHSLLSSQKLSPQWQQCFKAKWIIKDRQSISSSLRDRRGPTTSYSGCPVIPRGCLQKLLRWLTERLCL